MSIDSRRAPTRCAPRRALVPALVALALLSHGCRRGDTPTPETSPSNSASSAVSEAALPSVNEAPSACLDVEAASATVTDTSLVRGLERARASARARSSDAAAWVRLGRAWLRVARETGDAGFALNADACAGLALERDGEHAGALAIRQALLMMNHEFARAREVAARVLNTAPDNVSAWLTESDAALELGDVDAAAWAAQRSMDLEPGLASYSRAAYLSWLHADVPRAIELMRQAIDAAGSPEDREPRAWALTQAALLFWHEGDYAGAAAGFELAREVRPRHAPALVGLAQVAAAEGQLSRARDLYASALELRPDVDTAARLGDVLARLNDAGAEAAYRRAEALGRSDRRALSFYYSTHEREPAAALELARAEFAVRPDPYTEDVLAWALHRNGQQGEALAHIEHARRLGTPDARLMFHHGAIALAAGQPERGRALLRGVLAQNPHFDLLGEQELRRLLAGQPS